MNLPDLLTYRSQLIAGGATYPLPVVQAEATGLLSKLPAPADIRQGWPWTEEVSLEIYGSHITWPKITIVTPSFNQDKFIEETIRSVLLQNYPNLEYIIMDGGSTDGTKQILEKYAPWISYRRSEKDAGQGQAINMGFSLASGAYYAWINSDDYYLKNTFSTVVNRFIKTKAAFVYGYGYSYHANDKGFELVKVPPLFDYFLRIPTLVQPSCFWSAEIHQPIWEELNCSMDYELWQRLVRGQKRSLIKAPLSAANVHDDAKTSDPKMKAAWEHDHLLICSKDAHGPVYNWNRIIFFQRIHSLLNKIGEKINLS